MVNWPAIAAWFRSMARTTAHPQDRANYLLWARDCEKPERLSQPHVLPPVEQPSLLAPLVVLL